MSHTRLSASTSQRWLNCPASVVWNEQYEHLPGHAAMEGTAAHFLAAMCLKTGYDASHFKQRTVCVHPNEENQTLMVDERKARALEDGGYLTFSVSTMVESVQFYLGIVRGTVPRKGTRLHVEELLDMRSIHRDVGGTVDCYFTHSDTACIFDYKHGTSYAVKGSDNTQLKVYALGVAKKFPRVEEFIATIVQPRVRSGDRVSGLRISRPKLMRFASWVRASAIEAEKGLEAGMVAGEWCTFCRHRSNCVEYIRAAEQRAAIVETI